VEAKILNCPVLATDVAGVREQLIHGITGWVVDNEENAICEGLKHLLCYPDLLEQLRSNVGMEQVCDNEEKYRAVMKICRREA
jgi:glycosyltransferase involved in cell wall biosynthesis